MYPQSELDNYKLQVELLQEKLKRSEDNRHQLEHQLEHILHKRNELDKLSRLKTRQKYQEFLDEQHKRNERNKMLMQMLERIDEQTATLSARSERLKMMKLQYEMYFAKLVQAQTLRCIQAPPPQSTATAIPVLLPSNTAVSSPATGADASIAATTSNVAQKPTGMAAEIQPQQQQWTLALATPTQGGMLLSAGATPTALAMPNYMQPPPLSAYDAYLHYPLGAAYMAHSPRLMAAHAAAAAAAAAINANTQPAFIDFSNGNSGINSNSNNNNNINSTHNDIYQRPSVNDAYSNNNNSDYVTLRDFDKIYDASFQTTPTTAAAAAATATTTKPKTIDDRQVEDKLNATLARTPSSINTPSDATKWRQRSEVAEVNDDNDGEELTTQGLGVRDERAQNTPWQLSSMSPVSTTTIPTSASSSMAFDKLPKSLLTRTKANIARIDAALGVGNVGIAAATAAASTPLPPTTPSSAAASASASTALLADRRNDMAAALAAAMKPQIEFSASDFATLPSMRDNNSNNNLNNDDGSNAYAVADNTHVATASRQKIDAPLSTHMLNGVANGGVGGGDGSGSDVGGNYATAASTSAVDDWLGGRAYVMPPKQMPDAGLVVGGDGDVKALAPHEPPPQTATATASKMKPPQSIENIENAIYGELVQPPNAAVEHSANLRSVTQGVLDDFLAQQQQRELPEIKQKQQPVLLDPSVEAVAEGGVESNGGPDYAATYASVGASDVTGVGAGDDTTISSMSYAEQEPNSEPTYATIDNANNNNSMPEAYQTAEGQATTAIDDYSIQPTGDQSADGISADQQQQQQQQLQQQEYDYSNYNASDYDPNAYPGYTYDEATGQYIPDAETTEQQHQQQQQQQQDEAYAAQMQAYEQQQQQQQQYGEGSYDYSNYEQQQQPTEVAAAMPMADDAASADAVDSTVSDGTLSYEGAQGSGPAIDVVESVDPAAAALPPVTPTATTTPTTTKKAPTSILSTANATSDAKKKKRVNFVDSSETDESVKGATAAAVAAASAAGNESDFDFSTSEQQQ